MYAKSATGVRNWKEQPTTPQAFVGEEAVRGPAQTPEPAPTPSPTPTPKPPAQPPVNASLKGDVPKSYRSTTGPMDYPATLDYATKKVSEQAFALEPYAAQNF